MHNSWSSKIEKKGGIKHRDIGAYYYKNQALILFIKRGNVEAVQELLEKGTSPNVTDLYGNSAAQIAIENKNLLITKLLIDQLEVLYKQGHYKYYPLKLENYLHIAKQHGAEEIANFLKEKGAVEKPFSNRIKVKSCSDLFLSK